jgi:hypothetical protein
LGRITGAYAWSLTTTRRLRNPQGCRRGTVNQIRGWHGRRRPGWPSRGSRNLRDPQQRVAVPEHLVARGFGARPGDSLSLHQLASWYFHAACVMTSWEGEYYIPLLEKTALSRQHIVHAGWILDGLPMVRHPAYMA